MLKQSLFPYHKSIKIERAGCRPPGERPFGRLFEHAGCPLGERPPGAILFVALWTLVLLVTLSVGITTRVSSEIRFARYLKERVVPLYLAKAAVRRAVLELEKDKTPAYDTLFELRKERQIEFESGSFSYGLIDEESLVNINSASEDIIGRLPGLNPELAKAVFESGLKPFSLKEELLLIDGITPEIFSGFKDLITTYGEGRTNINTASGEALKILGVQEGSIETILTYRKGADSQEITEDDGIYASVPAEVQPNLFTVSSRNIKVDISTKISSQPSGHYAAILDRSSGKIKSWKEK